jgi:hypothetical protein
MVALVKQYPASGTWAVLDGVTYMAGMCFRNRTVTLYHRGDQPPPDPRFAPDDEPGRWTLTVLPAECDELYSVTSRARYRGHVCQVMAIGDGTALLYSLEGNRGEAESLGFQQVDPGTHAKDVDVHELVEYCDVRRDLLFDNWRQQNFPRPAEDGV